MYRFLICSLLLFGFAENAQASFILTWSGSNMSIGGAPIFATLTLTETVTTNISDFGLAGGSVAVTRNLAGVGTLASVTASPLGIAQFDTTYATAGSDPVLTINQTSFVGAGIGSTSVVLGTFTINATVDGIGSLSVAGLNNAADDVSVYTDNIGGFLNLGTGTPDDVFASAPTFNYTFTAVPEPTSMALVGVVGVAGLVARYRRRGVASPTV